MTSLQPPGHLRDAHFLISPFSTSVSLSGAINDWSGSFEARSVRKSKRRRCSHRKSFGAVCFILAHHVQKRVHISPTQRFCLVAAGAVGLLFDQRPALISRMKAPHARGHHTGFSGKTCYARQPLIDRHCCRFGRERDHTLQKAHGRLRIAMLLNKKVENNAVVINRPGSG